MNITTKMAKALAEFPEHADRMDKATRRIRWILRGKLACWLAGALIMTACTAQLIDQDAPWWLITASAAITAPWIVGAANLRPQFERLQEMRAEWAAVRDIVADEDFQQLVRIFTGVPATSTTVDEDPTPAEPPAPAPEGTKP
jgi:hypothetical protein